MSLLLTTAKELGSSNFFSLFRLAVNNLLSIGAFLICFLSSQGPEDARINILEQDGHNAMMLRRIFVTQPTLRTCGLRWLSKARPLWDGPTWNKPKRRRRCVLPAHSKTVLPTRGARRIIDKRFTESNFIAASRT